MMRNWRIPRQEWGLQAQEVGELLEHMQRKRVSLLYLVGAKIRELPSMALVSSVK